MAGGTRRARREEFAERPGGTATFSVTLLHCADGLLGAAFADRTGGRYTRPRDAASNHSSEYAVGAVVMIVHAFEAWLNETVADLGWADAAIGAAERPTLAIADRDLVAKVERLGRLRDPGFAVPAALPLLVAIRNEFVHHLPRWFDGRGRPACVDELDRLGVLVHADVEGRDYGWTHQVTSYRLAWWAFETVEAVVAALGRPNTGRNFSLFRHHAPPPDDLPPWVDLER